MKPLFLLLLHEDALCSTVTVTPSFARFIPYREHRAAIIRSLSLSLHVLCAFFFLLLGETQGSSCGIELTLTHTRNDIIIESVSTFIALPANKEKRGNSFFRRNQCAVYVEMDSDLTSSLSFVFIYVLVFWPPPTRHQRRYLSFAVCYCKLISFSWIGFSTNGGI